MEINPEIGEVYWDVGEILNIREHNSPKGKGLSYLAQTVKVLDAGGSGGWDVYDGINVDTGEEVSFYGFSVKIP